MGVIIDLSQPVGQAEFALICGITQQAVSRLVVDGILERGDTAHGWLMAYTSRLREQAAGRQSGELGGLDLVQERAALARSQRRSVDLKNAVVEGTYAPIELLTQVLATASQAVVERFDQLPGQLRKVMPDLPDAARTQIEATIAKARSAWIQQTAQLIEQKLLGTDDGPDDTPADPFGDAPADEV